MYTLSCFFCQASFKHVGIFANHLNGKKHRNNLHAAGQRVSGVQQKRLQYLVRTHLGEEPVLGLEYIVEKKDPPFYVYSCFLCNVRANFPEALQHILSQSHVVRYIRKHHDHMWPKHPHKESLDEKSLKHIACVIQEKNGRQNINSKTSDATATGAFPWLYCVTNTFSCSFCSKTFPIDNLELHLKCRNHCVRKAAPELLKEQLKLQCVLDTCFKEEPILGLEYIVEEFICSSVSYKYTCLLCHVEYNECKMAIHLLTCEHRIQYIDRHHSELSVSRKNYKSKKNFQSDLQQCALMICKKDGKKTVQVKTDVAHLDLTSLLPEEDDGIQTADLPSTDKVVDEHSHLEDGLVQHFSQEGSECDETAAVLEEESKREDGPSENCTKYESKQSFCSLCGVTTFTALTLCQHIMEEKHRMRLKLSASRQVKQRDRLQYILDTYMKEKAVLGLEYVVEQEKGPFGYIYTCLLCNVKAFLSNALRHIMDKRHIVNYIEREHKDLLPENDTTMCDEVLAKSALMIQEKYGRKQIQIRNKDDITIESSPSKSFPQQYIVFESTFNFFNTFRCELCAVNLPTKSLTYHVMEEGHRRNLQYIAPGQLKELDRLQCFLDTHLGEAPLLGLEYIVEEFRFSFPTYKYICQLCNVEGKWYTMVLHIISEGHMMQYIDKHHSSLSLLRKNYCKRIDFLQALIERAVTICKNYGRKRIQAKSPDDSQEKGQLTCKDNVEEDKNSCLKDKALQPSSQNEKDVESKTEDASHCFRKPEIQQCICTLCEVSTFSVVTLCLHIMGWGHKANLQRVASQQEKEKDRLQYILDTYMKKEVILGLEYLVEREKDSSSYSYTCLLCNVEACLSDALTHVLDKRHTVRYMERKHKDLLPDNFSTMSLYNKVFTETASVIQERYGRKEIQVKNDEEATKDNLLAQILASDELESRRNDNCSCSVCDATFSVTDLNKHVMGKEHRINWERTSPKLVEELSRLKYLLDVYLKDCPLLGLEYILEMQMDSGYRYICMLCNLETDCYQTIDHMTGEDHLTRYIDKHHCKLSLHPDMFPQKEDYKNALSVIAFHIYTKYGRKDMQVKLSGDSGIGKRTSSTLGEQTPDPKKRRLENCSGEDIELDETSPIQELEFRRNGDLFNYLRDFAIDEQVDALFVQKIIQNCANSLFRFEQQQGGCTEES